METASNLHGIQVRLLGSVDFTVGENTRPVSGLRRKAVLAVLALHAGRVVSTHRLIDAVWDGHSPATARNTLQSHVSYLRRALGAGAGATVVGRPPGYLLTVAGEATDVHAAERMIQAGRRLPDPRQRASQLRAALRLWRGRPLADVRGLGWFDEQAQRLERMQRAAERALTDARLALGDHVLLVPELEDQAELHPFDEDVHRQLMLALYRSGRQADALSVFRRVRAKLRAELGIDPGGPLRALELAILRQDASLEAPQPGTAATVRVTPAQLPAVVGPFVGREHELHRMDELATTGHGPVAITGLAGVGKTTLAVRWAHQAADRFPDGQLYVDLRGFTPDRPPMDPADAVRAFLAALDVPGHRTPTGLDAQAALYRSLLADKRVLVVLDNAHDADQVRPLLPGATTCLALVTSRNQLSGLVAEVGAYPLTIDPLTPGEAHDLLVRRLGRDRVGKEPDAVAEIIDRCAGLPLALTVVAARAATHPRFSLAALASELCGQSLDALAGVRAALSGSYRHLSPAAAQLFRSLGTHSGPEVTESHSALAELARVHLIVEHRPGRYAFDDLLRAYAVSLTE